MTGLVGYKPSRFGSGFLLTAWKDKQQSAFGVARVPARVMLFLTMKN